MESVQRVSVMRKVGRASMSNVINNKLDRRAIRFVKSRRATSRTRNSNERLSAASRTIDFIYDVLEGTAAKSRGIKRNFSSTV